MQTLLLDVDTWDLTIDGNGNIAVADSAYSLAQDAASAIKTFLGEVFYNTALGIPYFDQLLGFTPPINLVKNYMTVAALTVPGVSSAVCYVTGWTDRQFSGQVQVTDAAGNTTAASF